MTDSETSSAALAPAPRQRRRTEVLLQGEPDGQRWIAWVMKRTYRIHNGRCELDTPGRQEVLHDDELPYNDRRKPPRVSPPLVVDDLLPFRRATDVVVQAFAHAYRPGTRKLTASVQFGEHQREIVVHGDHVGELDRAGKPRFSEATPIEVVPVRYDYAYGGVDLTALGRNGDILGQFIQDARRGMSTLSDTPYHYPRNPCGYGYLMELDAESFTGLPIPNLEYPFDPLTPQRICPARRPGCCWGKQAAESFSDSLSRLLSQSDELLEELAEAADGSLWKSFKQGAAELGDGAGERLKSVGKSLKSAATSAKDTLVAIKTWKKVTEQNLLQSKKVSDVLKYTALANGFKYSKKVGGKVYSSIDAQYHDIGDLDASSDGYSFGPFALGDRSGVHDDIEGDEEEVKIDKAKRGDRFAWRGEADASAKARGSGRFAWAAQDDDGSSAGAGDRFAWIAS
ncbi:hypothetical protein BE17_01905 [Sorangium cellulosum]|uniref:DUF2169 domain-containing protein n=1 Tax=Sorangium cellulosum TaxID=56 RepID=A0A150RSR5_SORCE|nr:hypothetical protein BE17_01905 [Sorangium cellulosum]